MPSGDVITMERFTCSNSTVPARRQPSSAIDRRHSLDPNTKRAASQCTTSNCVCGVPYCTVLANSLTSKSGQGVGFILETCEYATFNGNPTEDIEYCFDDLGVSATELFDICTAAQQGECGGTLEPVMTPDIGQPPPFGHFAFLVQFSLNPHETWYMTLVLVLRTQNQRRKWHLAVSELGDFSASLCVASSLCANAC
ncbi:hypothetical protein BDZ97DRAFT_1762968 [Flammula alnicola]|nr:hypothetical protein BDZ97DRAFT_1762968 [Flammula alnicola]